jgi:hypothetical protein
MTECRRCEGSGRVWIIWPRSYVLVGASWEDPGVRGDCSNCEGTGHVNLNKDQD